MKALYRKYRPKSLSEVVGQENVTESLKNSIDAKKISHAYIFTGPRGTGKTSVARIFAHEINGFKYELEDSYVDIIEIDAASNTGVDNIRELRERAIVAPTEGKYKIYIIDEVHMLSKSAFNALLKILEEPPKHVVFILATTDIQKVPVTILSRVQKHVFSLAKPEIMQKYLKEICEKERIIITDDALKTLVQHGGGSFRDSLSLLEQISTLIKSDEKITKELIESTLGLPQNEQLKDLLNSYKSQDLKEITEKIKSILNSGLKPESLSEELIKKIIENPIPEYMPLLEKLPEVKSPFPEAKLVLAFTNIKNIQTNQFIKPNNKPTIQNNTPFVWEEFKKNVGGFVKSRLEKCTYRLENTTLHIYPPDNTTKNILEKQNNLDSLHENLKGYGIEINDPTETKKENNNPKISKINDIMGETQEVENDGEIPF